MEKFNLPEEQEQKKESSIEKIKTKYFKQCSEKITIGGMVLALTFMGVKFTQNSIRDTKWKEYIEKTQSQEDKEEIEILKSEIKSRFEDFSDVIIDDIETGDKIALLEKDEDRDPPHLIGFDEETEEELKEFIDEEKGIYPKGWVNGEVEKIILKEDTLIKKKDYNVSGYFSSKPLISKPYMVIVKSGQKYPDSIPLDTTSHELGHANDWYSNRDLNLKERYELFIELCRISESENAFYDAILSDTHKNYHDFFKNGTKRGLYKSIKEYWAEICEAYIQSPIDLRRDFPENYNLVDQIVKKKDPDFDPLDNLRIDPYTGEKTNKELLLKKYFSE